MRSVHLRRVWGSVFVVLGVGLVVQLARAAPPPPPPDFWNFTISNSTGAGITDIDVNLYKAGGPGYDTMDPTPIRFQVSELPHDGSVVVTLKNTFCIMKITAMAKCGGNPLKQTLSIVSPMADYDGDGPNDLEYAGFCHGAPPGQADCKPELEFRKEGNPLKPVGELRAKWRWGLQWPAAPVLMKKGFN